MLTALLPEIVNREGRFPCVVAVDHAGAALPPELGGLGLDPDVLASHHALDRGAGELAARLDAPAVLCPTSRLVIGCNRWLDDPRSILPTAGGRAIPGNAGLGGRRRRARAEAVFWPYHEALGRTWKRARSPHGRPVLLALHSFTRTLGGVRRRWDTGTIWNERQGLSDALLGEIGRDGALTLGSNEPCSERGGIFTVDRHSFGTGAPGCELEIADDRIACPEGRTAWAERLARALGAIARVGAMT